MGREQQCRLDSLLANDRSEECASSDTLGLVEALAKDFARWGGTGSDLGCDGENAVEGCFRKRRAQKRSLSHGG